MRIWRICTKARAATALDGEGAKRYPGRWNHKGVPVAYCASSLSLSTLEYFVHVDPDDVPDSLVSIRVDVPDDVAEAAVTLEIATLPRDWRTYPGPDSLKTMGSDWAKSGASALLVVPSAVTLGETNILVNPKHADAAKLVLQPPMPFTFDPRMWK